MQRARSDRRLLLGSLAALLSAVSFSMNVTLAGAAYAHGANIHALNLTRSITFWLCLVAIVKFKQLSLDLPRPVRTSALLLGGVLCLEMYVMLGAILFIPVALAIVIMYTYPLMIAVFDWVTGRGVFSWLQLALMAAVFVGLALALSVTTGRADLFGVLLALAAGAVLAILLILSERTLAHQDNTVIMFYMLTGTCAAIVLLCLTAVDLEWPSGPVGWAAFLGSGAFYVLATFMLFTAVDLVGPLRTAIIDNTSPVWAILFGYVLLGQALSPTQITGVIMVAAGVLCIQWIKGARVD